MSIFPHSSAETYFIYCVGQSLPVINAFKAAMAHAKVPAKPLLGRYKGQCEYSFISRMCDYTSIEPWLNAEESILHIHSFDARDRPLATLKYLKQGIKRDLGRMVPVSCEFALQQDAYTYDPTYNTYFICQNSELSDERPASIKYETQPDQSKQAKV